ncbi:hypothetical protein [uncultured Clostridium sp.]|nr:hypothetical protein [uncultured Clostridium sp.]
MKKIIVGIMIGISLFGLVGCGGSDNKDEPEVKEPVKTIEIQE